MKTCSLLTRLAAVSLLAGTFVLLAQQQQRRQPRPIPEGVTARRDLVYASPGGRDLLLDLYLPAASRPLPLVVWIHGGGWRSGGKDRCSALQLTRNGYAVASVGYRLTGESQFPVQIQDCKAAIRWLRANAKRYGLDADHIGVWGSSAGGHLVALLGTSGGVEDLEGNHGVSGQSSRVQAVVDYFGPTDFLRMDDFPGKIVHNAPDSPESLLIGGPIQQNPEKVARANPIAYVTENDPPFLIVHGDKDPLVPIDQSRRLEAALKTAGVDVHMHVIEGGGHGGKGFSSPETLAMVTGFLDRNLRPGPQRRQGTSPRRAAQWEDPNRAEPAGAEYVSFESRAAGGPVSYLVYLPPGYDVDKEKRYPVIYWLHGLGGNQRAGAHFVRSLDEAIGDGKTPPAITVLVNGMIDSMYCDATDGGKSVESVVTKDLVPHVDRTYRTLADRRARAIEGYSMGGFGAAHLGFKYPELFGAVSVMAGALHNKDSIAERRAPIFRSIFGGDKDYFRSNSPWLLVEKEAGRIRGNTHVRIGVGADDGLLEWNTQYHELLGRLNIDHDFFVVGGVGHNGRLFYKLLGDQQWIFYREAFGGP